jgi:hypothetical protein
VRKKKEVEMTPFTEMSDEERLARLERKAAETRKMLFGALLLAKDAWKDELSRRGEGLELMKAMEKAEESFTEGSQPGRFKRLEHTLDVIEQRASSIFEVMSYISKYGRHD